VPLEHQEHGPTLHKYRCVKQPRLENAIHTRSHCTLAHRMRIRLDIVSDTGPMLCLLVEIMRLVGHRAKTLTSFQNCFMNVKDR
jgi:hypothetical protein